ncbi:MAG: hypothetical protein VZR27_13205 [Acutalibacteraceae bacterium]|nr:hypothetical protein [Acutalibacteraceae bacterium]
MTSDNYYSQSPQSYSKQLNMKDRFLTITALSGEFPYKNIYRVGADSEYIRLMRHRLYKEQFISLQTEEHLKGLVITGERMSMYKESYPERFKYSEDRTRMEVSRRYRKQLFALTYCSLANADIEFLPDKKPFIFSRSRMIMFLIHLYDTANWTRHLSSTAPSR